MRASGWFAAGALACALGVAFGAFGAHGMKGRVPEDLLDAFEVGVRYHLLHGVGLLAVGWAAERWPGAWTAFAGCCFLAGILLFSGSLYLLAWTGARWLGAVTPIGGVSFLAGWVALAIAALRS